MKLLFTWCYTFIALDVKEHQNFLFSPFRMPKTLEFIWEQNVEASSCACINAIFIQTKRNILWIFYCVLNTWNLLYSEREMERKRKCIWYSISIMWNAYCSIESTTTMCFNCHIRLNDREAIPILLLFYKFQQQFECVSNCCLLEMQIDLCYFEL